MELKKQPKHIISVAGLITNDEDKVLMIKHPRRGWEIPGGQVEEGEDLITALKREIFEETGVNVEVNNLVGLYSNLEKQKGYNGYEDIPPILNATFIGNYVEGELMRSSESIEVEWINRDKVLELVTSEFLYGRIKNLLEFDGTLKYNAFSKRPYTVHVERNI